MVILILEGCGKEEPRSLVALIRANSYAKMTLFSLLVYLACAQGMNYEFTHESNMGGSHTTVISLLGFKRDDSVSHEDQRHRNLSGPGLAFNRLVEPGLEQQL